MIAYTKIEQQCQNLREHPVNYIKADFALIEKCRFSHGDNALNTNRVAWKRHNVQNKYDLQERAIGGDYFLPQQQIVWDNRPEDH